MPPLTPPAGLARRSLLAAVAALALLLAACDGSSGEPEATPSPTAQAATATPVASQAGSSGTASPTPTRSPTTAATASPTPTAEATAAPSPTPAPADTPTPTPTPDERVASTSSIPRDELPVVEFVRANGAVVRLPIEVPPRSEYVIGLSGRYHLDDRGMLFYYPEARGNAGFWMKDTRINLSIAFVDTDMRIIEIHEMQAESLDVIRPAYHVYLAAIEAPAGWYAWHGIEAGDEVRFAFELPAHLFE